MAMKSYAVSWCPALRQLTVTSSENIKSVNGWSISRWINGMIATWITSTNWTISVVVEDNIWNTWSCETWVNNISTWVLAAPTGLASESGTPTNDNTPTFTWTAPSSAGCREVSGYRYEICSDVNCDTVVDSWVGNTTTWTTTVLPDGSYHCRVQTLDTLWWISEWTNTDIVINTRNPVCELLYEPHACTTGAITLTLTGSADLHYSWTWHGDTWDDLTKLVQNGTYTGYVWNDAWSTWECSTWINNFDNEVPEITDYTSIVTWYECETITWSIVANDGNGACSALTYNWNNWAGILSGYGIKQDIVTWYDVSVSVVDAAGNSTGVTIHYQWFDRILQLTRSVYNTWLITWNIEIINLAWDDVFGAGWYGSCETLTVSTWICEHAQMQLQWQILTITPTPNYEWTWACTIIFTDGDTTQTWTIKFDIDTKWPTGDWDGLWLTWWYGSAQCTHQTGFIVTGIFSEAVTWVILTWTNVTITSVSVSQWTAQYVWRVTLSWWTGKVRFVNGITDMYGNTLSGNIGELIIGNYDEEWPNKVQPIYPLNGIVPTTSTTLQWSPTTDKWCASGVTYSYILTWTDYENSWTDLTGTSADVSGLVNGQTYCRTVIATDRYGNDSDVSNRSCFTVNTDGIQCNITANRTTCGSWPIVLTLAWAWTWDARWEWLSRSSVWNTGTMTKTWALTKTITWFVNTTWYVQNKWWQTWYCAFTIQQVEDILDLEWSQITGVNYRSWYECETWTIQLNVSEDGCGLSWLKYQWNGVDWLSSKSIYGQKAQVITWIFSAINGAGVTTTTWYTFEWFDSPLEATGFTVDLTRGNTVNWKQLSAASDGACGSDTVTATASSWSKWECRVDGGNLIYVPSYTFTWSDSCVLTISDDDGWSVPVVVTFENVSPYVELISPEDNKELDQWNVTFTWIAKDVPLTKTISWYRYQVGTITWFVNTTWVTLNLPSGTYPRSVAIEYADGTIWWHSDLWSVKTVARSSGWWWHLVKDHCPNGDNSDSYYDGVCDNKDPDKVADYCGVNRSNYTDEQKWAYLYAYMKWITTMCPISTANLDGYLHRDEFAKMISVYAINVVWREPNYSKKWCDQFNDVAGDTPELQSYMKLACQLELMWMHADGVTPKAAFDPYSIVTRAEFGTVFSRLLFGDMYNVKNESEVYKQEWYWYKAHLQALKDYGIMTKVDGVRPKYLERRWRAMLMLQRADNYGVFQWKSPAKNGVSALFSNIDNGAV